MKWGELIQSFDQRPFFETREVVATFAEPEAQVQARLSRWVAEGKLVRLRRGKYLLPATVRRSEASAYHISNYLLRPSYVSLLSALEYHTLIPEAVGLVQALTPKHGNRWETPAGTFIYATVAQRRFFGYRTYSPTLASGRSSGPTGWQRRFLMARPEKALLDLFYAGRGEWTAERIEGLRLQNLEQVSADRMLEFALRFASPKVMRAARRFLRRHRAEVGEGVIQESSA